MKIIIDGKEVNVGGSGENEVYSTEETRIGTWIDGKPLYRKTVTVKNLSGNVSTWFTAYMSLPEEFVVMYHCFIESKNDTDPVLLSGTYIDFANTKFTVNYNRSTRTFLYWITNAGWFPCDALINYYYTKTTDSAQTS